MNVRQPLTAAAIAALVCAAVLALRSLGGLERFDLAVYDSYVRAQRPLESSDPAVAILELTDADLLELGRWPVTDAVLADALTLLGEADARVIGVDLYREIDFPPGSETLEARLRSDPRIFGVRRSASDFGPEIAPPKGLAGTDRFGFAEMLSDRDGILRRGLLFQGDGEYSFGLRLALAYLAGEGIFPSNPAGSPGLVRIGPTTVPRLGPDGGGYVGADAGGYQILLDFRRPPGQLDSFSLSELRGGGVATERIRDRIVIIGVTAEGVHDVFDVPVVSSLHAGRGMPGVEVQAHVTDQLVRLGRGDSEPVHVLSTAAEAGTVLLLALVGAAVGLAVRRVWGFALLVLAALLTVWLAGLELFRLGLWIPVVGPGLAAVSAAGLVTAWVSGQERAQRALLMQLFSRHVSREIASEIWARRKEFLAGGRPRSRRLPATVRVTRVGHEPGAPARGDLTGITRQTAQDRCPVRKWWCDRRCGGGRRSQ